MRLAAALFALLPVAAPAIAQDATPAAAPTPEAERQICRRVAATGTILGAKKECHTRAEWNRIAERDRTDRENRMPRPRVSPGEL